MNTRNPFHRLVGCALTVTLLTLNAWAETITVGGVGSLSPLIQTLAAEFSKTHPGVDVTVISPPMGSSASLRALAAGKLDISIVARPLGANESGQARPWLQTPLVLATWGGDTTGLSRAQVAEIYAGIRKTWANGKPIRLVLRGENESETVTLRTLSPEIDAAVGAALKRTGLPIAENDLDAIDTLSRIQGSFGTTNLGLMKASSARVKALSIDGVEPTAKTAAEGRYPLMRKFLLVTTHNPPPVVATFVSWLQSPAGLATGRRFDFLPLK